MEDLIQSYLMGLLPSGDRDADPCEKQVQYMEWNSNENAIWVRYIHKDHKCVELSGPPCRAWWKYIYRVSIRLEETLCTLLCSFIANCFSHAETNTGKGTCFSGCRLFPHIVPPSFQCVCVRERDILGPLGRGRVMQKKVASFWNNVLWTNDYQSLVTE